MNQTVRHQLLGLLRSGWGTQLNELVGVVAVLDFKAFKVIGQLTSQLFHESHIRTDNALQDTLSEELAFCCAVFATNEVVFIEAEELKGLSSMEAFLDTRLAVHLVPLRISNDMILIIESVVLHIVAESCHQKSQSIKGIKLSEFIQVLCLQNEVNVLCDIGAVQVVVVLDTPRVLIVDLDDEAEILREIDLLHQIVVLQERCRDEGHLHVAPHHFGEVKQVKVEGVDGLKLLWVGIDQLLDHLRLQVEVNHLVHIDFDSH